MYCERAVASKHFLWVALQGIAEAAGFPGGIPSTYHGRLACADGAVVEELRYSQASCNSHGRDARDTTSAAVDRIGTNGQVSFVRTLALHSPAWPWISPPSASSSPWTCLLYTSPSPRDRQKSRMPSSA